MNHDNLQEEIVKVLLGADEVYKSVLSRLNLPADDEIYQELVLSMLKRQTRDHLVFSVWNNLTDEQADHLKDFVNQYAVIEPEKKTDEVILEFAFMYPTLMEKIHQNLSIFFQQFVRRFNELTKKN